MADRKSGVPRGSGRATPSQNTVSTSQVEPASPQLSPDAPVSAPAVASSPAGAPPAEAYAAAFRLAAEVATVIGRVEPALAVFLDRLRAAVPVSLLPTLPVPLNRTAAPGTSVGPVFAADGYRFDPLAKTAFDTITTTYVELPSSAWTLVVLLFTSPCPLDENGYRVARGIGTKEKTGALKEAVRLLRRLLPRLRIRARRGIGYVLVERWPEPPSVSGSVTGSLPSSASR